MRRKFRLLYNNADNHFSKVVSTNILFGNVNIKTYDMWYKNELKWLSQQIDDYEELMRMLSSCRKGCSSCCKQSILINPTEFEYFKYVLSKLDNKTITDIKRKAKNICNLLNTEGISLAYSKVLNFEEQAILSKKYFDLDIECPLLNEGECLIYESRPLVCATYRSYGDSKDCAKGDAPEFGYPYVCLDGKTTLKMYDYLQPQSPNFRLLPFAIKEIL